MRVLILGVTGMLGSAIYSVFASTPEHETWGTLRDATSRRFFPETAQNQLIDRVDVMNRDALLAVMDRVRPEVVVNAVGVVKQLTIANDPLTVLPINAMFPHRLAALCHLAGARMIHISSDCVYSGRTGGYVETDLSDAQDLYGKSKYIGEVHDCHHVITLRTSAIGHELDSQTGLLEWFLSQQGRVKGYARAIYSGLPCIELARVIAKFVLPDPDLYGLYHVASQPISKLDLLKMIAEVYAKNIVIDPDDEVRIDRSMNAARFSRATGYIAPNWGTLIADMHDNRPQAAGAVGNA